MQWRELTDSEKKVYEELARKDKERYMRDMDVYNGKKPGKKVRVEE